MYVIRCLNFLLQNMIECKLAVPSFKMTKHLFAVCRLDIDATQPEGIMSNIDIPESIQTRSNDTGEPVDCTFVIYAPKAHRVRFEAQWNASFLVACSH